MVPRVGVEKQFLNVIIETNVETVVKRLNGGFIFGRN